MEVTLHIQALRPGQHTWMAWAGNRMAGKVASLEDVKRRAAQCDCQHVEWHDGAYDEMVAAGVAPAV